MKLEGLFSDRSRTKLKAAMNLFTKTSRGAPTEPHGDRPQSLSEVTPRQNDDQDSKLLQDGDETVTHANDTPLRFGRLLFPQAAKYGYTTQEYVWVDGTSIKDKADLNKLLEAWELDAPNLIISVGSGSGPHPHRLLTPEALNQAEMQPHLTEAMQTLELVRRHEKLTSADTESASSVDETTAALARKLLSENIHNRLVMMMRAIVDACAQTNCWLAMEDALHGSPIGTRILHEALSHTTARPVILVLGDTTKQEYQPEEYLPGWMQKRNANWTKDGGHTDGVCPTKAFRKEQKIAWKLLEDCAITLQADQHTSTTPVARLPLELFDGEVWEAADPKLQTCPFDFALGHKWGQFVAPVGTHYVLARSTAPLALEMLGPCGCVMVSGSEKMVDKFLKCFGVSPIVILKHSGRACDFLGHAVQVTLEKNPRTESELLEEVASRYPFWYDANGFLYGVHDLKFTMYQVATTLVNASKENSAYLQTSILVVDPWVDTPEFILQEVSKCFVNTGGGIELGAGNVEEDVILFALEKSELLSFNAAKFAFAANAMTIASVLLSFFATVLSVCITVFKEVDQDWADIVRNSSWFPITRWSLIIIPAVAGLLAALLSKLRYTSKWAALHMASRQVDSEIYKFRVKATDYETVTGVVQQKDRKTKNKKTDQDTRSTGGGVGEGARRARKLFVSRVSHIVKSSMLELREDACAKPSDLSKRIQMRQEKTHETSRKRRIDRISDSDGIRSRASSRVSDIEDPLLPGDDGRSRKDNSIEPDNLLSTMQTEDYVEHRMLSLLESYEALAPKLAARLNFYEVMVFVAALTGTILAALHGQEWIPIAVALSSVLNSFFHYEGLQNRLTTLNSAITDIQSLHFQWQACGVVEKRMRSIKNLLVEVTENAYIREAAAYAGSAASSTEATQLRGDKNGKENTEGDRGDKEERPKGA